MRGWKIMIIEYGIENNYTIADNDHYVNDKLYIANKSQ